MNNLSITSTNTDRSIFHSIREMNEPIIKEFENRRIYITEKLRGIHVRFSISEKEVKIYLKNTELKNDDPLYLTLYEYCKIKHFKAFGNIFREFSNNPIVLFFELVNNNLGIKYFEDTSKMELFLIDIYINTNWVNWDDIQEICKTQEISAAPFIYNGLFSEEIIENNLMTSSVLSFSQPKEGLVIRPTVEDYSSSTFNNRLIAKITHPSFKKPEPILASAAGSSLIPFSDNGKSAGDYFTRAGDFLEKNITQLESLLWEEMLKKKNIEIKKENINKIMPELVKDFLEDIEQKKEIDRYCKEKELDFGKFIKALKRMLPSRIRKELKF